MPQHQTADKKEVHKYCRYVCGRSIWKTWKNVFIKRKNSTLVYFKAKTLRQNLIHSQDETPQTDVEWRWMAPPSPGTTQESPQKWPTCISGVWDTLLRVLERSEMSSWIKININQTFRVSQCSFESHLQVVWQPLIPWLTTKTAHMLTRYAAFRVCRLLGCSATQLTVLSFLLFTLCDQSQMEGPNPQFLLSCSFKLIIKTWILYYTPASRPPKMFHSITKSFSVDFENPFRQIRG